MLLTHFGKHVNLTSQINVAVCRKTQCQLKKVNYYQNRCVLSKVFYFDLESIMDSLNLFSCAEDTPMTTKQNSIIKNFAFSPKCKSNKNFEIRKSYLTLLYFTETIKRVINNLDVKKAQSGEVPFSLFKNRDFIFDNVTACVTKSYTMEIFLECLKYGNVDSIHKRDNLFDKQNYG